MDLKGQHIIFLLATLLIIFPWSEAHKYHVGGKGGWIVNPHVRYNHWSDRTRFVIHDSLVFKYEKGEDSVLLVTKDDYYNCDIKSPIARWDDGATEVSLNRSGAFFFISGEEEHCHKGQRLIVVVLSWSPQPIISLPPESAVPEPPHASPVPGAEAPMSPPPSAATPVRPPTGSPSSPRHYPVPPTTTVPPSSSPLSPSMPPSPSPAHHHHHHHPPASPQTPSPTSTPTKAPAAPAPAPVQSSASAVAGHHALLVAVVTILLSASFSSYALNF